MRIDHQAHALAGAYIAQTTMSVCLNHGVPLMFAIMAGLAAAAVAGVLKDYVWDEMSNRRNAKLGLPPAHDVDKADALNTFYGGIPAVTLYGAYYAVWQVLQ